MALLVAYMGASLPVAQPLAPQFDEAVTSRIGQTAGVKRLEDISISRYLANLAHFEEGRRQLKATESLRPGWDTYDAEAPNDWARKRAAEVLAKLAAESLPPARLMPSVEGGIAISFAEGDRRAEIEIYNTGEIVAATYSGLCEPKVWELGAFESDLNAAVRAIRVHLTE